MVLSYKTTFPWGAPTHFPEKIKSKIKIHTMREDEHNRWKENTIIHMATGVRSKHYHCFELERVISIQKILIQWHSTGYERSVMIKIDGRTLSPKLWPELARNDGFDSVEEFFRWFSHDFSGKLIHWTDFKY